MGCTVGVAEAPGIIPIPTASSLWFFCIHVCLLWEHALGGELAELIHAKVHSFPIST